MNLPVIERPEIPVGMYCYGGWYKDDSGKMRQKDICPHWQRTENGARCNVLNEEHYTYCPWHLVWDKVKECGINKDEEHEAPSREEWTERCIREGYQLKHITCVCGREMDIWHKGKHDTYDTREPGK